MRKNYCDICGREIPTDALAGGIMRQKEIHEMVPAPKMGIEGLKSAPGIMQTKLVQEIWDLCKICEDKIWKEAEKLRKESDSKKKK